MSYHLTCKYVHNCLDIACKNLANPLATILSVAMMLRTTFKMNEPAKIIELAVRSVLNKNFVTADIFQAGKKKVGTAEMGDAVAKEMELM